ncbi:hypothetical protein NKJ23_27515 [Mesorhizobium sp. M0184]|uniref:hypothetical protein n=1 Tax=Mesorhizobium sp. M0184 TaxID=2956906 RepID=UPI00333B9F6B
MADRIRIRIENWLTANDRGVLRHTIAPAIHITASTLQPVELPSWNMGGHIINVRALKGSAFVEVGNDADASAYDPEGRGKLLIEGESDRWLVRPDSYIMIHEWKEKVPDTVGPPPRHRCRWAAGSRAG